jgi:hypothetical protein
VLYTTGCGVSGQLARYDTIATDESSTGENTDENTSENAVGASDARDASDGENILPIVVGLVPRPIQWNILQQQHPLMKKTDKKTDSKEVEVDVRRPPVFVDVACGDHHTVSTH